MRSGKSARKSKASAGASQAPVALAEPATLPRSHIIGLFLIALVIRLLYVVAARRFDPLFAFTIDGFDQYTYQQQAHMILGGDLLLRQIGAFFYSPMYSYFLAVVYRVCGTDNYLAVHLVQAVLGAATATFLFICASTWLGRRSSWIAALLWVFSSTVLFYEQVLLHEGLILLCYSAVFWGLRTALTGRSHARVRLALAGCACAWAAIGRNNAYPFLLIFPIWIFYCKRRWRLAGAFVLGSALVMLPLLIRNKLVVGQWSPMGTNGNVMFYLGNAADSTGELAYTDRFLEIQKKAASDPSAYYNSFVDDLKTAPGAIAWNLLRKTYAFLDSRDIPDNAGFQISRRLSPLLFWTPVQWEWLVPMGLIGLFLSFVRPRDWGLLWMFAALFAASIIIIIPIGRYRLPILIPLTIWSAFATEWLWANVLAHRIAALAVTSGVLAILIVVLLPWSHWQLRRNEFFTLSAAACTQKDFPLSRKVLQLAYEEYPQDAGMFGQGLQVALVEGDSVEADRLAEEVWKKQAFDLATARALVNLYTTEGKMDRVKGLLQAILKLLPGDPDARQRLATLK